MGIDALGLIGLLAVPAVLALHRLRRRFPPRIVSALFLFGDVDRTTLEGPRRDRLRASPSFWIELAAAAIFSTLLLLDRTPSTAPHHVFVLDGSASLRAEVGSERALDRIRAAVRARVDRGDRVTLVESGSPPSLLLGPAAPASDLDAALDAYEPWRLRHDPMAAFDLARALADAGRVTFFTDREPDGSAPPPSDVAIVGLGRAAPNAGIVAARREPAGVAGKERIEVTIGYFADPAAAPGDRVLRSRDLESGADVAEPFAVRLVPGERRSFSFEIAAQDSPIEVALTRDALAPDDSAVLAPPRRATLAIASSLAPDAARELGFESGRGPPLDRLTTLLAPATVVEPALADLCFAATDDPKARGDRVILPLAAERGSDDARRALVGPFLVDRAEAITEGLTLESVIWTVAPATIVPGEPLISAGNLPLWSREEILGSTVHHLLYDPFRSNLHLAPDWPILLSNVGDAARARIPGLARTNLGLGELLEWRSPWGDEETTVALEHASGTRREHRVRGRLVIPAPSPPGDWTLRATRSDGSREESRFGVALFDPGTSNLLAATTFEREVTTAAATSAAEETWTTSLLALLLVALLLADAWVLRPGARITAPEVAG